MIAAVIIATLTFALGSKIKGMRVAIDEVRSLKARIPRHARSALRNAWASLILAGMLVILVIGMMK